MLEKAITVPLFIERLLFNKDIVLKREQGAVNVLLLGIGGGDHDGANLADTIIFAHIDPTVGGKITLVSIPRDLWVPVLQNKVNTAYAFGEARKKGGGLTLAKATLSDILGQPIDYALRIDFPGFVKIVDEVGGLDINVDQNFDDYEYPILGKENALCGKTAEELKVFEATASPSLAEVPLSEFFPCRVEHLHFEKGMTHMDGALALKYVRSRHAQGSEGTDFARSRRQQKVLVALRDKVLSLGILFNPFKFIALSGTLGGSIDTDIKSSEFAAFVRLFQKVREGQIKTTVLDQGNEGEKRAGLLVHPPIAPEYQNAWVLIPITGNGDFSEIKQYVACEITKDNCAIGR
jgi:LCP family protein required for cell wall assembly